MSLTFHGEQICRCTSNAEVFYRLITLSLVLQEPPSNQTFLLTAAVYLTFTSIKNDVCACLTRRGCFIIYLLKVERFSVLALKFGLRGG